MTQNQNMMSGPSIRRTSELPATSWTTSIEPRIALFERTIHRMQVLSLVSRHAGSRAKLTSTIDLLSQDALARLRLLGQELQWACKRGVFDGNEKWALGLIGRLRVLCHSYSGLRLEVVKSRHRVVQDACFGPGRVG